MSTQEPLKLDQLGETYEVIGELAGRKDAHAFLGTRREDGRPVLIVVARTPEGDEGNALSHLAADANLLATLNHGNLLPIVGGHWVGTDAFAMVTERTEAPTLDEMLSRRDEEFTYARIANVLREANEVLEWARGQKIVHRSITPETLYVEPGSDRVRVSFAIRALPRSGIPGAEADARCIAELARAMLTRSPAAPERADLPLAELRPGLPTRLIEDTEALLQASRGGDVPDISTYIAQIAMADAVKGGEVHLAETRSAMEGQQRAHREQLDKERLEHDAQIAKERKAHDEQLASERKEHERFVANQANQFQKERDDLERQLAKERKALEKERGTLAKERESHRRDLTAFLTERTAQEREAIALRERLRLESEALATQAELYAHTAELTTPVDAMPVIPSAPIARVRPSVAPPRRLAPTPSRSVWWTRALQNRPRWDRSWNRPAAAAGIVLLLAVTALAFGRSRRSTGGQATTLPAASVLDSVAGGVAAPLDSTAGLPADLVAGVAARADSQAELISQRRSYFAPVSPPTSEAQRDSVPRDSAVKRDSVVKPKADSTAKRDSLPKVDSLLRRDSVATPDTNG